MTDTSSAVHTLAYSNCPVPNALLVGRESQLLAEAGINLDVLGGPLGSLHFTYDHPAYTRFGGEIPPLVSEGLRAPGRTRLLGVTLFEGKLGFYAADPTLTAPEQLAGHRVGVSASAIRILRGDLNTTMTAIGTARNWGIINANEGRRWLNMPPRPDKAGEDYLEPLNMVSAGELPQPAVEPPQKVPAPPPSDQAARNIRTGLN